MNKKKKTILLSVLGIPLIIAIIIGTTYAFWKITKVQEGEANTLTTTCLDVDLTSMSNGINLQTQFPITDEDGRKTEGYTFKISNKCDTYVSYDINLESLNNVAEANRLNLNNLVAIVDDGNVLQLGYYPSTSSALKTNEGIAYDTRKLTTDTLSPGSTATPTSKEYTLRVWLDEDASIDAANKEWSGKISISASPVIVENAVAKLTELAKTNTKEMFTDDTVDANIRYMGKDPANYVTFGNEYYSEDLYYGYLSTTNHTYPTAYPTLEACQKGTLRHGGTKYEYNVDCEKIHSKGDPILWRVIGAMNNVEDGTGKKETRLKVIRDENIGNQVFSEACSDSEINAAGTECTTYHYDGDFITASINSLLNNEYYHKKEMTPLNGYYPPRLSEITKLKQSFSNTGMPEKMKTYIGDAVYYLGGYDWSSRTPVEEYAAERTEDYIVTSSSTWTGKVGLMYPSDYALATDGGESGKTYCEETPIDVWGDDDCAKNSWILGENYHRFDQWAMVPDSSEGAVVVDFDGFVGSFYSGRAYAVRPVVYLKSDVKIMSGDGTKENPYKLGL